MRETLDHLDRQVLLGTRATKVKRGNPEIKARKVDQDSLAKTAMVVVLVNLVKPARRVKKAFVRLIAQAMAAYFSSIKLADVIDNKPLKKSVD